MTSIAERLLEQLEKSRDANERDDLRKRISDLHSCHEPDPQIALLLARATERVVLDRHDAGVCAVRVNEIASLRQKYGTAEIAQVEAEALDRASMGTLMDAGQREQSLARLAELSREFGTPGIAAIESEVLYRAIVREPDGARRVALLRRIEAAQTQHAHDSRIRFALANARVFVQAAGPNDDNASPLLPDDSPSFLLKHARAIRHAARRADPRTRRDLEARIDGLFERHPSPEMAIILAETLVYASGAAAKAPERIAPAERIEQLIDRFPSSWEIAVLWLLGSLPRRRLRTLGIRWQTKSTTCSPATTAGKFRTNRPTRFSAR